jgi:hypothetical protein
MEKTCLHRFCSDKGCKNCKEDYESITPSHPVNNYSCRNYYEIHVLTNNIVERVRKKELNLVKML